MLIALPENLFISQYKCQEVQRFLVHCLINFHPEPRVFSLRLVWSLTLAKFLTHWGLFFTLVVSALYIYKFSWFFHLIPILALNNVIFPKIWVFIKTLQCLSALLKLLYDGPYKRIKSVQPIPLNPSIS